MDQVARDALYNLAYDLSEIRSSGANQRILFLGGRASTIQGRPFIYELQQQVLLMPRNPPYTSVEVERMTHEDQTSKFEDKWLSLPPNIKSIQVRTLHEKLLLTE